jgi:hypothetical protein
LEATQEATQKDLEDFLKSKADEFWREAEQPYLLSQAGPDLKAAKIDYRTILGDEKLKMFVKRTGPAGGYRLVEHPIQRPKVGIVPADVQFSFPTARTGGAPAEHRSATVSDRERVVVAFLRALSSLTDDDLAAVSIPVRVLAKLVRR